MLVKNISVTLLRCDLKEGVGKESKKPYRFYQVSVVDEDAKVFNLNLSDDAVQELGGEESNTFKKFLETRNETMDLDLKFSPKGFDIAGTIVKIN